MTYAYDISYLEDARRTLGEAFDYAANTCHIELDIFMDLFITGGFATQFGSCSPKFIAGMSGPELVWETILHSGQNISLPEVCVEYSCSPEYWVGWALTYYQWYTGFSFKTIRKYLSMRDLEKPYSTLHEASEDKLINSLNLIIERRQSEAITHLQSLRRKPFCPLADPRMQNGRFNGGLSACILHLPMLYCNS